MPQPVTVPAKSCPQLQETKEVPPDMCPLRGDGECALGPALSFHFERKRVWSRVSPQVEWLVAGAKPGPRQTEAAQKLQAGVSGRCEG